MTKRRKSLRKEAFKATFEGKKSRIHFTIKENQLEAKLQKFEPNPNTITFGTMGLGKKRLKMFAFRNQPKLVFIRVNDQFFPLDKFKLRELVSFVMKGAWFIGLLGKRAKKYAPNTQR